MPVAAEAERCVDQDEVRSPAGDEAGPILRKCLSDLKEISHKSVAQAADLADGNLRVAALKRAQSLGANKAKLKRKNSKGSNGGKGGDAGHGLKGMGLQRTTSAPPAIYRGDYQLSAAALARRKSRSGPKSKSSTFIGVSQYRRTGRWEAHIWECGPTKGVKGKQLHLGSFTCAEDAARAYDRAAIHFRGEVADTNYPAEQYACDPVLQALKHLSKKEFVLKLRAVAQHHKAQQVHHKAQQQQQWPSRPGPEADPNAMNAPRTPPRSQAQIVDHDPSMGVQVSMAGQGYHSPHASLNRASSFPMASPHSVLPGFPGDTLFPADGGAGALFSAYNDDLVGGFEQGPYACLMPTSMVPQIPTILSGRVVASQAQGGHSQYLGWSPAGEGQASLLPVMVTNREPRGSSDMGSFDDYISRMSAHAQGAPVEDGKAVAAAGNPPGSKTAAGIGQTEGAGAGEKRHCWFPDATAGGAWASHAGSHDSHTQNNLPPLMEGMGEVLTDNSEKSAD